MRVKAALWPHGPALYFRREHLALLEEHGYGVGGGKAFDITVQDGRFAVLPSNKGPRLNAYGARCVGIGWDYRVEDGCQPDHPRGCFGVVECEARFEGIRLMVELPAELPPLKKAT